MSSEIHVSFPAINTYAQLCRKQEDILALVEDVVTGSCANFGAYTGFMGTFAGPYRNAQGTVAAEVARARKAASDLATNIDATVADFEQTDSGVADDLGKLRLKVTCAADPGAAPDHGDGPGVPVPVKTANAGAAMAARAGAVADNLPKHLADGLPGRAPQLPDAGIRGLPTDGVGLIVQLTGTVAAAQSIGRAQDDQDLYDEFENDHRKAG